MQIATPADDFDARLSRVEGTVEQLSQRMASLETRMGNLETRVDQGFREINARMDTGFRDVNARVDSVFRWMIGIQFTTLVALGTLILVKL